MELDGIIICTLGLISGEDGEMGINCILVKWKDCGFCGFVEFSFHGCSIFG
jgi:hypothetical protein